MSKESYARGFCKAAEAAGVDPVALAKYAQQYKTEGWAPESVSEYTPGSHKIPNYSPGIDAAYSVHSPIGLTGLNVPNDSASSIARSYVNPKFKAWWEAHKKAFREAGRPVSRALQTPKERRPLFDVGFQDLGDDNSGLMRDLAKIYHDSMAQSTGGVSRAGSARIDAAKALRDLEMARSIK